jgi:hypothetical protein
MFRTIQPPTASIYRPRRLGRVDSPLDTGDRRETHRAEHAMALWPRPRRSQSGADAGYLARAVGVRGRRTPAGIRLGQIG